MGAQVNFQLTGKISLKFDFNLSLLSEYCTAVRFLKFDFLQRYLAFSIERKELYWTIEK